MPMHREFLGGERPALIAAADFLLARYARGRQARLGGVSVVLPSSRAARRLLEILVTQCERRKLVLEPPLLGTLGNMPEQLYEIKKPLASELTQTFAWAQTLRSTPPSKLDRVIPHPPQANDWPGWLELGELVQQQHRELASDCLNFAGVLAKAKELPGFDEEPRWQALDDVQQRYLRLLDSLEIWDVQTARLFAIEHKICRTKHDLVLIGIADMNLAMRQMLDQVAERVTALVHAPAEWSDRFDTYGCVRHEVWGNQPIAFDDEQVLHVDGPADQAYAVAEQLASFSAQYRADEITLGLGDDRIAPQIARQLSEFNVTTRSVVTCELADTPPFVLLSAIRDYLAVPSFAHFAALVRHPDVYDWLMRRGSGPLLLTKLDELQLRRLPSEFLTCDAWLKEKWQVVAEALDIVCRWLAPLREKPRPLAEWIAPIEAALVEIYNQRAFQRDDPHDHAALQACEMLHNSLAELLKIPPSLAPPADAPTVLRLVLDSAAHEQLAPLARDTAVEMLGWFELPLDDAPALIVTTFNDGFVPSAHGADIFLPNRLREHLGLEKHSDRLYAREAYAASILLATRAQAKWIVARRDAEQNPLAPSRLLFAADRETIARRARRFFDEEHRHARPKLLLGGAFTPLPQSRLEVPAPRLAEIEIDRLRVTDFRLYLACPYRFYLQKLLRLSALADAAEELDALQFGNLLHQVLQNFGSGEESRRIDREEDLADWLATELYSLARDEFGEARRPSVNVQIEQLRLRLNAFAAWQALRTAEGWHIAGVEVDVSQKLTFGAHEIEVVGRIDRLDHHAERGEWMVFDYKSGDAGDGPQRTHRKRADWVDLQLPLYRRLTPLAQPRVTTPRVGYILLPKDRTRTGAVLAEWNEAEWKSADDVAARVVASIRARCFWPPNYDRLRDDDFTPICQDNVAGRRLAEVAAAVAAGGAA